ncbi:MAG: GAF domain-containing protein, partial [Gaiellales bacterium]
MALAREHLVALAALQAAAACDQDDRMLPRLVLAALARLVQADGQIAWLRDEHDRDAVRTLVVDERGERAFEGLVAADPLLTRVLLDGARSFEPDASELRGSSLAPDGAHVVAAPVELGSAPLGALAVFRCDGTAFEQDELDLLALGASTLALTLVAIAGREDRARSIERENLLVSTLTDTAMAASVQLALEQVAAGAVRIASAPLVAILLAEPDGTRLSAVAGADASMLLDLEATDLAPLLDVFEPGPL